MNPAFVIYKINLMKKIKTFIELTRLNKPTGYMLLFWPSLFFLEGGDTPEASEYARIKGEVDALNEASIQKSC